jgi:hypothetical protein
VAKAPTFGEFKTGLDPNNMNRGLKCMPITIAWHSIKPHLPTFFNTFLQISWVHLLPPKLSILQIWMMGVLVVANIALLSQQVVHAPNKEMGTLPIVTKGF